VPFCEHCGDEMGYLPFKCKYCGGTFCKEHRLPENHNCTFEIKHTPTVSTQRKKRDIKYEDKEIIKYSPSSEGKKMEKFLKKQEKQRRNARKIYEHQIKDSNIRSIGIYLIIVVLVVSILGSIKELSEYICLSSRSFFQYHYWTFLTSIFSTTPSDIFGLFILFIMLIIFFNMIKIIELRFGGKFLLQLYLLCTLFAFIIYVLIWLPIELLSLEEIYMPIGLAYSGLLGVIAFLIYFNINSEMTMLLFFIPIRMKGKVLLLLLVLLQVIPAVLFAAFIMSPLPFALYLPNLGGLLASYLIFRYKFRKIM